MNTTSTLLPLVAGALLTAGCYAYVPVEPERLDPGAVVRARLTPEGGARLADRRGQPRSAVEGVAISGDGTDTLTLSLWASEPVMAAGSRSDTVRIPMGLVAGVERKELSTVRTSALVIGGAAVLGVLVARAFGGAGGGGSGDGDGGDDRTLVPRALLRAPIVRLPW